jgi:hypothetical protein
MPSEIPIYSNQSLINDQCYVKQYVKQNRAESDYRVTNYRRPPCKKQIYKNPGYHNSDNIGLSVGYVNDCNVSTDSKLTRGAHMVPKPADRLAESVTTIRYLDFLPTQNTPITNARFLVSTELRKQPQDNFNPVFDRKGINTRHHIRKEDFFYKKQQRTVTNKYGSHGRYTHFK